MAAAKMQLQLARLGRLEGLSETLYSCVGDAGEINWPGTCQVWSYYSILWKEDEALPFSEGSALGLPHWGLCWCSIILPTTLICDCNPTIVSSICIVHLTAGQQGPISLPQTRDPRQLLILISTHCVFPNHSQPLVAVLPLGSRREEHGTGNSRNRGRRRPQCLHQTDSSTSLYNLRH